MKMHTMCRLCSACCPVEAQVDDGRLVSAMRKSFLPPRERITCPKLAAAPEIVYSEKRLRSPLVRDNKKSGRFREAGWDEALTLVAEKLERCRDKGNAPHVAWLRGMAADWGAPWDYVQRLMHAFGSPNAVGNGSVCHVAREMAHNYTYGAMTLPRITDAECILIWGKNDRNTMPAAHEAILHARRRGAKLIVVDPVQTPAARMADIWLQVKPAHDGQLAMAMINEIIAADLVDHDFIRNYCTGFDALKAAAAMYPAETVAADTWLDPDDIRAAARMYASAKPACIVDGNGLDMQLHTFQATRAVSMLRALTGNLDAAGGDFIPQPVRARNIQLRDRLPEKVFPVTQAHDLFSRFHPNWGLHAQSCLVDAIVDETPYPVTTLVVQSGNPAVTMADSGRVEKALEKLNFLVVIDPFFTATAGFADVVLPASMCFEKTQLNRAAMRTSPAILQNRIIDPLEGTRPDWQIVFELARKLGLSDEFPWADVEDAIDYQLEPSGITVSRLRENPEGVWDGEIRYEKYKTDGFNTPSGKVEFYSERLAQAGHLPTPYMDGKWKNPISFVVDGLEDPLVGISGERENRFTHSQFHHVAGLLKENEAPQAGFHPDDAAKRAICPGDLVRISTPKGEIQVPAAITDKIRAGSVLIPWGWGEVHPEYNLNRLTDDDQRDPVTSTPSSRTFMCCVEKC